MIHSKRKSSKGKDSIINEKSHGDRIYDTRNLQEVEEYCSSKEVVSTSLYDDSSQPSIVDVEVVDMPLLDEYLHEKELQFNDILKKE